MPGSLQRSSLSLETSTSPLEKNVDWIDRSTYWLSTVPQGTSLWDGHRKYRLTASNFGTAAGHNLRFKTPSQLADDITGIAKIEVPDRNKALMAYGTSREPFARKWYQNRYSCTVKEVGLAVWKENPLLGCSTDGIVMTSHADPHGIYDPTLA